MKLLRPLSKPFFTWVKASVSPEFPQVDLNLDPSMPVLYVIKKRSFSDLMVLDNACKKAGLPRPTRPAAVFNMNENVSGYMYLAKLGWWQPNRDKMVPPPLVKLISAAQKEEKLNVQIVPVTIVWGRNPGHGTRSWFKLLFSDDEQAGLLQKFLIVLAQGRDVVLHFGRPISLRSQIADQVAASEVARKLRRVMLIHMRQQRVLTTGPNLYDRNQVSQFILSSKKVKEIIASESKKKGGSVERMEARARKYVFEISAEPKYSVIRFFDLLISWMIHKMYQSVEVKNLDRVRQVYGDHELIFVSSHRTHMDYLLLGYVLYKSAGMAPPHQAAGANLNFWPAGSLLRRGCGFFLRRSFGGNRLYTAVFTEYLNFLMSNGYTINFFPEGGRSRTGRLLKPKTGMIAMVVQNFYDNQKRPVLLVPVNITYDKIIEVKTYLKELQGAKKEKESAGLLFRARRVLQQSFGSAYVSFGKPIPLESTLDRLVPHWDATRPSGTSRPEWLPEYVAQLSHEVMCAISNVAVISPSALVSLAVLASPQRAVAEEDLELFLRASLNILRDCKLADAAVIPNGSTFEVLELAKKFAPFKVFNHSGGNVLYLNEFDGILQTYYRNSIIQYFMIPSLIAKFVEHHESVSESEIISGSRALVPFVSAELFNVVDEDLVQEQIRDVLVMMQERELLYRHPSDQSKICKPVASSKQAVVLHMMGRVLGSLFDRFGIAISLLARSRSLVIGKSTFENDCQLLAQRISLLAGDKDPEQYEKMHFQNMMEILKRNNLISIDSSGDIKVNPSIHTLANQIRPLLSSEVSQSMARAISESGE